jgi:hypothetical protein
MGSPSRVSAQYSYTTTPRTDGRRSRGHRLRVWPARELQAANATPFAAPILDNVGGVVHRTLPSQWSGSFLKLVSRQLNAADGRVNLWARVTNDRMLGGHVQQ